LRQKNKELEKVYAEIENELGRSASDKEVADKLGITVDELNKLLNEVNLSSMISLEEFLEQNYEIGVTTAPESRMKNPKVI